MYDFRTFKYNNVNYISARAIGLELNFAQFKQLVWTQKLASFFLQFQALLATI